MFHLHHLRKSWEEYATDSFVHLNRITWELKSLLKRFASNRIQIVLNAISLSTNDDGDGPALRSLHALACLLFAFKLDHQEGVQRDGRRRRRCLQRLLADPLARVHSINRAMLLKEERLIAMRVVHPTNKLIPSCFVFLSASILLLKHVFTFQLSIREMEQIVFVKTIELLFNKTESEVAHPSWPLLRFWAVVLDKKPPPLLKWF